MPVIPPGVPAVRTVAIGGPSGPQGVPGQSAIQRVAAAAMSAGQVVRTHAAGQEMQAATTDLRTRPFDAILLGDIGSGATGNFHVAGPVPANVLQLGAGVACAVGVDASGVPVRATDPTCVSAPNWLGTCDALGNVTIGPFRRGYMFALDFGAVAELSDSASRVANTGAHIAIELAHNHADVLLLGGEEEVWPSGNFYFAADPTVITSVPSFAHPVAINVTRANNIRGAGARYSTSTQFWIPDGVTGFRFYHSVPVELRNRGTFGSGARIQDIQITAEGSTDPDAHGFDCRTAIHWTHTYALGFGGHGYWIISQDGFPDLWHMQWCRAAICQDGIHVQGGDANNGVCIAGDFQNNRGWGVWDESFLGTLWMGCHTAENMQGAYAAKNDTNSNPVGPTVILNCYSEADQPPSRLNGLVTVVGGEQAAGFTADSSFTGGTFGDDMWPAKFIPPVTMSVAPSGTDPPAMSVYGNAHSDSSDILSLVVEVVTPGWPFGYDAHHVLHPGEVLTARYSTDGGSTWTAVPASPDGFNVTHPGTIGRADEAYTYGNCKIDVTGWGVSFNFLPEYYSADNVYTGAVQGAIRPYFQAAVFSPPAAMGFGHKDKASAYADPADWKFTYRETDLRWRWVIYNSQTYESMQYAGGRALPSPGQILFSRGVWSVDEDEGFNRIGWVDGSESFGSIAWRISTNQITQWYRPGDVMLNHSTTGPWAWRATVQGGWAYNVADGHDAPWHASTGYAPGDSVRPIAPNGYIYRAQTLGVSGGSQPTFPTTIGQTVVDGGITWICIGTEGNPFEPLPQMAAAQSDSGATDVPGLVADLNALLAKLRAANIIAT